MKPKSLGSLFSCVALAGLLGSQSCLPCQIKCKSGRLPIQQRQTHPHARRSGAHIALRSLDDTCFLFVLSCVAVALRLVSSASISS
ncbi:hypothetical protein PF010_g6121 [Phytophthora fragariae]|uniref:Secreted protein n=1 Tax=Phytophthora fragariae TaxID=53985 RepID=A0A6G0NXB0_9STRA|nr:hypothetical protein PF010_g6121 [Phytophthora fragariae]KAE9226147.1 hypothetical protein PF004_g11725 [Phytophthora fragariae]